MGQRKKILYKKRKKCKKETNLEPLFSLSSALTPPSSQPSSVPSKALIHIPKSKAKPPPMTKPKEQEASLIKLFLLNPLNPDPSEPKSQ